MYQFSLLEVATAICAALITLVIVLVLYVATLVATKEITALQEQTVIDAGTIKRAHEDVRDANALLDSRDQRVRELEAILADSIPKPKRGYHGHFASENES